MILLIGVVIAFMAKDLFKPKAQEKNPFAYDIEEFKSADSVNVCFKETKRFSPTINKLTSIFIDSKNQVYIAGENAVQVFDSSLQLIKTVSLNGLPKSMFVTNHEIIYLGYSNHIEVYSIAGEKLQVWNPYNSKSILTSIAVKGDFVFVADAGNKILLKYNTKGELLKEIGGRDSVERPKGFVIPSPFFDVAIGRQGEIWAVNPGLHQLEAYNQDGELFSSWKRTSMHWYGFSGCCNPSHISILSDGSFVTSEKGLVRIKIHEPTGDFKCVVAAPNEFDRKTKGIDLAVDSEDRIYALIPNENEIRIYNKLN